MLSRALLSEQVFTESRRNTSEVSRKIQLVEHLHLSRRTVADRP